MVPSNSRNAQIKLSLGLLLTCVAVLGIILVRIKMQRDVVENRAKYNLQSWIAHGMKGYSEFQGNGRMIPQAICDKDGKPLLSWRVALLPYIEEASRFGQFALDEPWDSPHNIKMLAAMPSKYESPRKNGKPGETFYQVFTRARDGVSEIRPRQASTFFRLCRSVARRRSVERCPLDEAG